MLAAAKYNGAGFLFYNSIKEMESITLFLSIHATAFIVYFLYTHLFCFFLIENIDLLLLVSSGLIVSSKSDDSVSEKCLNKPKVSRLTKAEQKQYIIPENLKEILVGTLLGYLWANKRGENTRLRINKEFVIKTIFFICMNYSKIFVLKLQKFKFLYPTKTGNVYETMLFYTYSLPCFSEIFKPFYSAGQKFIPSNIGDLLAFPLIGFLSSSRRKTIGALLLDI